MARIHQRQATIALLHTLLEIATVLTTLRQVHRHRVIKRITLQVQASRLTTSHQRLQWILKHLELAWMMRHMANGVQLNSKLSFVTRLTQTCEVNEALSRQWQMVNVLSSYLMKIVSSRCRVMHSNQSSLVLMMSSNWFMAMIASRQELCWQLARMRQWKSTVRRSCFRWVSCASWARKRSIKWENIIWQDSFFSNLLSLIFGSTHNVSEKNNISPIKQI